MKRLLLQRYGLVVLLYYSSPAASSVQSVSGIAVDGISSGNMSITAADSSRQDAIRKYYHLAIQYKDGDSVEMDYKKAFYYFSRAADLGDAQSIFAVGYMKYKGLGTDQDYHTAAGLFEQGANQGRDNSEYFFGLCYRNGYGLMQNEDSAQYWLKKSAALGYRQAKLELQSKVPENSNTQATELAQKIHNAAIPEQATPNRFLLIQPGAPDSLAISGTYDGFVIQYDWSGSYPVSAKKLQLFLQALPGRTGLSGKWQEENTNPVSVMASLQRDSLVFDSTHYKRKDHYSPDEGIEYDFRNASLNLVRKGDSVYLAGNLYMFSPDRKEPSKPLFIALARTANTATGDTGLISKQYKATNAIGNDVKTGMLTSVYPNPFTTYLNVEFKINEQTNVGLELYNMAGQKVYAKPSQLLDKGTYRIRIEPSLQLAQQTYLLRLVLDSGQDVIKVIRR